MTELGTTHIRLAWTSTGDDGRIGAAAAYDVRYSTSALSAATWDDAIRPGGEPTPAEAGNMEAFNVDGLTPATTYHFAIRVRDEAFNWSDLSNAVQVATPESDVIPPSPISDLAADNPTHTTARLTWTASGDDTTEGTASVYDVRYSTSEIDTQSWWDATTCHNEPQPGTAGERDSLRVEGLFPETTYYFAIKVSDEAPNWSPMSNVAFATTHMAPDRIAPAAVSDLMAEYPDTQSVTLRWTATGDDGMIDTASLYDIRYSTTPIQQETWANADQCENEPVPQVVGTAETFVAHGLLPSTTYYFAMKVSDEVSNWSDISNVAQAATLAPSGDQVPPAPVDDLEAALHSSFAVYLRWTATGDDDHSGIATRYDIRYRDDEPIDLENWDTAFEAVDEPQPDEAGSVQTYLASGLDPGTHYYFAVRVQDDALNWSGISNIVIRQMPSCRTTWNFDYCADLVYLKSAASDHIYMWWSSYAGYHCPCTYDIRYSRAPIDVWNWEEATRCPGQPECELVGNHWIEMNYTIHGLSPGTTYYVGLRPGGLCLYPIQVFAVTTDEAR
jgi:chitodextrinase